MTRSKYKKVAYDRPICKPSTGYISHRGPADGELLTEHNRMTAYLTGLPEYESGETFELPKHSWWQQLWCMHEYDIHTEMCIKCGKDGI